MEGTLWKWTNYFSGWQPRWFVLENGILSYYRAPEDVNNGCKGSIKMSVCDVSVHPTDNTRLDLSIPGEAHFYVKAATPQERQEWLIALGSCKAGQPHSPTPVQTVTLPDGDLKAKKSELRLYCDLLMQQVHSVKSAVKSETPPDLQKLDEATGLLSATCDTFIHTLDECMSLLKTQGTAPPTTPTSHSPGIREGVGPPTPIKSSHSKTSFHSGSVNRSTSADSWSAGGSGDEDGIVRGYFPRLQSQRSQTRSRRGSSDSSGTPSQHSPSHSRPPKPFLHSLDILPTQAAANGVSMPTTTNGDMGNRSHSFPPSPESGQMLLEESLRRMSSSSEDALNTSHQSPNANDTTPPPTHSPGGSSGVSNNLSSHHGNGSPESVLIAGRRSHPEDGIKDKIQTFFSAMEVSFQDIKLFQDGGIPTTVFLTACKETLPIFDKLNPTTFAPIKMEFSGNVRKLQQKYSTDPDQFITLQNMVLFEMKKRHHTNANSATVGLLWLKRGLQFLREFLLEYMTGIQDLHQASNNAYARSLKVFHTYVVRGVFALAAKSAPNRLVFTQSLAVNQFHTKRVNFEQVLLRDIEGYLTATDVVLKILDDFYLQYGINFIEQM